MKEIAKATEKNATLRIENTQLSFTRNIEVTSKNGDPWDIAKATEMAKLRMENTQLRFVIRTMC